MIDVTHGIDIGLGEKLSERLHLPFWDVFLSLHSDRWHLGQKQLNPDLENFKERSAYSYTDFLEIYRPPWTEAF